MYGIVFEYCDGRRRLSRTYDSIEKARMVAWAEFRKRSTAKRVYVTENTRSGIKYLEYYNECSFWEKNKVKGYTDTKRGTEYFYVDIWTGIPCKSLPGYMHDAWSW